jgi:hypothetical protein
MDTIDKAILERIMDAILYVYVIIMFIISILLLLNTILNVILYNYYKYDDKKVDYNNKKLYVHETLSYKIFISQLKDNLNNYNNYYFTLNTSSDLLKIFIMFTLVIFSLFLLFDIYILFIAKKNAYDKNILPMLIGISIIFYLIYYAILFCVNYYQLILSIIIIWFLTSALTFFKISGDYWDGDNKEGNEIYHTVSIVYIFSTFFSNKPDLKHFYITIIILFFIMWVLLLVCYGIMDGTVLYEKVTSATRIPNAINYDYYSFNEIDIKTNFKFNSLENYFHNHYLKDVSKTEFITLKNKLESYNIDTIGDFVFENENSSIRECIKDIILISNILKDEKYTKDYNKTRLDFIKLFRIFLDNEIIHSEKNILGRFNNENDLHKDFNFIFNMNKNVPNQQTYNIDNVLIGAFPLEYVLSIK